MVFGPFGVDAFALTNALTLLQQFVTRVKAPRDLLRDALYLSERQFRVRPHVNSPSSSRSGPLPSTVLLNKHPFLLPAERDPAAPASSSDFLRAARIFLRRDCYHNALQAVSRLQNDELLEQVVATQSLILHRITDTEQAANTVPVISGQIQPCINIEAAKTIRACPNLRLNALSIDDLPRTTPIHRCPDKNAPPSAPLHPIWPPPSSSPPLFSDSQHLTTRFHLLLSVASSLATAHSRKWYHVFLTPQMIRLPKTPASDPPLEALVLNFHHRRKGCKACGSCSDPPLPNPHPDDPFSFRDLTIANSSDRTPEQEDMLIFGNLVCWVYSSYLFDYANPHSDQNQRRLQFVPWPLRMLVTDALQIPLSVAALWLSELKKGTVRPYSHQPPFCPFPASCDLVSAPISTVAQPTHINSSPSPPSSPSTTASKSRSQVLQECCLRSTIRALETEEPQAALHVAMHFDLFHEHLARDLSLHHPQTTLQFRRAYDYYLAAAKLGSLPALLHVARLQALALQHQHVHIEPAPTHESVLLLLLEAAFRGSVQAYQALADVPKYGLCVALYPFRPSLDAVDTSSNGDFSDENGVCSPKLFSVMLRIAIQFRVGADHVPQRERSAIAWLTIPHVKMHIRSSLELGLLLVESAQNLDQARQGMNILFNVANNLQTKEGLEACFRLGRWFFYGLPHEFAQSTGPNTSIGSNSSYSSNGIDGFIGSDGAILMDAHLYLQGQPQQQQQQQYQNHQIIDHGQAVSFLKLAADGGHQEAMVLYAMILKKRARKLFDKDGPKEAETWLEKAGKCPMAYYAKAMLIINNADRTFNSLRGTASAGSFSSSDSSSHPSVSNASNPGTSKSSSILMPGANHEVPSAKPGKKLPFKLRPVSSRNSSGKLSVGRRNRSTLSAERDSQSNPRREEDDAMKRKVLKYFKLVRNLLVEGPHCLAGDFAGENLNPYPHYKAAEFMMKHASIWAECDPSVTEREFLRKAHELLVQVVNIPQGNESAQWKLHRRNWREEDMFYVRKAKSDLAQYAHMWKHETSYQSVRW